MDWKSGGPRPCRRRRLESRLPVDMNPILLKSTSQMGSQVIVNGEVFGNLRAWIITAAKREFIPAVREAFERLESQFDAIVLEVPEDRQRSICGTMIS